ncbi:hypothetical protein SMSK321_1570 [Streptococcus mitis SK321]|nr:hypothetical protein SMSK321_1570 [Streptococcus mitis SK321]
MASVGILNGCFLYSFSCNEVPHAQTRQSFESVGLFELFRIDDIFTLRVAKLKA